MATQKLPVLLIGFTKTDELRQVLQAVEGYAPDRLYIAQDGPRPGRPGDTDHIAAARQILEDVRWPTLSRYRFQDENLGVQVHVEQAISWFFENEPEGIILEDDTLPTPDFFRFCEEMIERYRYDKRVMMVGGCNLNMVTDHAYSYFFSREFMIWGWACWRDRWALYEPSMKTIQDMNQDGTLAYAYADAHRRVIELTRIEEMKAGVFRAWDYRWGYTMQAHHGLCIIPTRNLVVNLGFGEGASNTFDPSHPSATLYSEPMDWPLRHPDYIARSAEWESRFFYPGQHMHRYLSIKGMIADLWRRLRYKFFKAVKKADDPGDGPTTGKVAGSASLRKASSPLSLAWAG